MEKTGKIDIIIDTGIIYALADRADGWHEKAAGFLSSFRGRLIAPSPVLPEACYLLNAYLGQEAELGFIGSLIKKELIIEHFRDDDLVRSEEVLKKYRDQNIGFADALIIAISERLKIRHILTTDRRHFSVIYPNHCEQFILLP